MGLLEDPHLLFQVPGIFSRQRCLKAKGVQLGLDGLDLPSLIPDFEGAFFFAAKPSDTGRAIIATRNAVNSLRIFIYRRLFPKS